MNIRKWLCGFARPGSWLYRAADCQRYRPAEVITEHVEVTDTATGEVVYPPVADTTEPRTGLDVYQLIAFPLYKIQKYLDDLVLNGGSVLRVFMDYTWPTDIETAGWRFSIFKQVGWWTEVGGDYSGQRFPLFTVSDSDEYGTPFDEQVMSKWGVVSGMCAERNISITFCIFDGCSMKSGLDRRHQPLLQNYQHHGADGPAEYERMDGTTGRGLGIHTGGVYGGFGSETDGTMKSYLQAIVKRVVEIARVSGVNYRIMPGNEMERVREGVETQAEVDAILHDWHNYMIEILLGNGVAANQIVVSITGANTREGVTIPLLERYPGIIEQIHGPNSPESLADFSSKYPGVEIDGDGFDNNAAGYTNGYNFTMPSIEQASKMREEMKSRGIKQYSTFNGYVENPGWQDISSAQWEIQRALGGR